MSSTYDLFWVWVGATICLLIGVRIGIALAERKK